MMRNRHVLQQDLSRIFDVPDELARRIAGHDQLRPFLYSLCDHKATNVGRFMPIVPWVLLIDLCAAIYWYPVLAGVFVWLMSLLVVLHMGMIAVALFGLFMLFLRRNTEDPGTVASFLKSLKTRNIWLIRAIWAGSGTAAVTLALLEHVFLAFVFTLAFLAFRFSSRLLRKGALNSLDESPLLSGEIVDLIDTDGEVVRRL